jgi:LysR family transcriptional regulator, hydrogen peroxide-inducible genes activator
MTIQQLQYFHSVARTGSFSAAAKEQGITQPSLSQQIQKLEKELDTRLFDRIGRGARLTDTGRNFLPRAQAVLQQISEVTTEAGRLSELPTGELRIGAIPTIAPYLLPSVLLHYMARLPGVKVRVSENIAETLLEQVKSGMLDVAVLSAPVPSADFDVTMLLREPLYLAVPRRHPLAAKNIAKLREVAQDRFILLKDGLAFRQTTLELCKRANFSPQIFAEAGHFASVLSMVAAGLGISVVPQMVMNERLDCRLVPLQDKGAYRDVAMVTLKGRYCTRALTEFLTEVSRHGRAMVGSDGTRKSRSKLSRYAAAALATQNLLACLPLDAELVRSILF